MKNAIYGLIDFLENHLQLPASSINLALKQAKQNSYLLPITLWQNGLISLAQLDQIFDWLYSSVPNGEVLWTDDRAKSVSNCSQAHQ